MTVTLKLLFLLPLLCGVACMLIRSQRMLEQLNLATSVLLLALPFTLIQPVLDAGFVQEMSGFLRADALSVIVCLLTGFVYFAVTLYSVGFMRIELAEGRITDKRFQRYYAITPMFVSAMMLVPIVDSLGVMWVILETSTLASVLLIILYNQKTSLEAAWKFIIIGSIGIALALFGTVVAYYSGMEVLGTDSGRGMNYSELIGMASKFNPDAMRLAFVLVLLGYGTKAGLAPMHTWKPDAYSEAPLPSAALMGAAFVNCALYAICRFYSLASQCLGHEFPGKLLVGFGIASILVAAPFVIVQRNFRRILAYSSIDHAGIMVAAIGFGGKLGALAAVLHMVFHAITKPLMFFAAGNIEQQYHTQLFRKVHAAIHVLPWTSSLFLIAGMALCGLPPFCIFQSEFLAASAAIEADRYWIAAVFILGLALVFTGFLVNLSRLNLGAPVPGTARASENPWKMAGMMLSLAATLVVAVIIPSPLYQLILNAAQSIGGNQ